jgi:hypothetical protein
MDYPNREIAMRRTALVGLLTLVGTLPCVAADEGKWVSIKGKFVWDDAKGTAPKRTPIKADKDAEVCAKDKDFNTEQWVVNAKTGGIKNVIVWLGPDLTEAQAKELATTRKVKLPAFEKKDIHPALVNPAKPAVSIDQPCCRFIPHVVLMREGQDLVIKNSSAASHNARFEATDSGIPFNQIIPQGREVTIKGLKPERLPVEITCSMHSWMNARLAVFAHPYFALTDDDGNFEIKDAPVMGGKLRLFAYHEAVGFHRGPPGRYGRAVDVKGSTTDVGPIKLEFATETKPKK